MATYTARQGVVLTVAGALMLCGCGPGLIGGPAGEPLLGARLLSEDPAVVEIEFSGCNSSPEVDVFESESAVRITVAGPNGGCEPVYELTVELDEPLGTRTLVDGATGDEVEVAGE